MLILAMAGEENYDLLKRKIQHFLIKITMKHENKNHLARKGTHDPLKIGQQFKLLQKQRNTINQERKRST